MDEEMVKKCAAEGFDCSQTVFASASEKLGIDKETAYKIAACFGGGMHCGEVCGAVTGALMAIGLKYGNCKPGDVASKQRTREKMNEFYRLFLEEYDSTLCKKILGYDFSIPEEAKAIIETGVMKNTCPALVAYAANILEEVL